MRPSKIALLLVLLLCTSKAVRYWTKPNLSDFRVYETAALLVREHRSLLIYNGADTGADPQLRFADPQSVFAGAARQLGIDPVRMYVYPPILADLLLPMTLMNARHAGIVWNAVNVLILAGFVWLCTSMLQIPWKGVAGIALVLGTITYKPMLECLTWGQITIVLLGLWTLGVYCYARGWIVASALALALATSIKLTPLVAIVPFLLWKEWRWLRVYLLGLAALFLGVLALNGPMCLEDCFRHVIPAMSAGIPDVANRSLLSSFQLFYVTWKGGDAMTPTLLVPHVVGTMGKATGLLCLAAVAVLVARYRASSSLYSRALTLSLFPLLSVLISPVSWMHAYVICLLPLVMLWAEALRTKVPVGYLALLTVCSVELNWFAVSYALRRHTHGPVFALTNSLPVVCGMALILYRLAAMPRFAAAASETPFPAPVLSPA